jgi:hypothetical protein
MGRAGRGRVPESGARPLSRDLRRIRTRLLRRTDLGPHDFIREAPAGPDSRAGARELTAPLAKEDDFRLLAPSAAGALALFCRRLPWDSAFFGTSVARLDATIPLEGPRYPIREDLAPALACLDGALREGGVRQAFAIVDARDIAVARALARNGWAPVEARMTFYLPLSDVPEWGRYAVRRARPEDLPSLVATAVGTVNPYDRFHADPGVSPADADRMMAAWVEASMNGTFADAVLVPDAPAPTAFGTIRLPRGVRADAAFRPARFVLGAVGAAWKGWYVRIVAESCRLAREAGATHLLLDTQAANRAAIRTCEKLGFRYGRSSLVLRADFAPSTPGRGRRARIARKR